MIQTKRKAPCIGTLTRDDTWSNNNRLKRLFSAFSIPLGAGNVKKIEKE